MHPDSVPSENSELHYTQSTSLLKDLSASASSEICEAAINFFAFKGRMELQDLVTLPRLCQAAVQDMVLQLEDSAATRHGPAKLRAPDTFRHFRDLWTACCILHLSLRVESQFTKRPAAAQRERPQIVAVQLPSSMCCNGSDAIFGVPLRDHRTTSNGISIWLTITHVQQPWKPSFFMPPGQAGLCRKRLAGNFSCMCDSMHYREEKTDDDDGGGGG